MRSRGPIPSTHLVRVARVGIPVAALLVSACGPPELAVRPLRYDLDVRLDPVAHTLDAEAAIDLARLDGTDVSERARTIELRLHPGLTVDGLEVAGAEVSRRRTRPGGTDDEGGILPSVHRFVVAPAGGEIRLVVRYRGELLQDVEAGEIEGQIHNFVMAAHVGEDGVYLDPDGFWYPTFELPEMVDPDLSLADFRLTAEPIEAFELVAGLEGAPEDPEGRLRWASPFPLEGLVLLGGPLARWSSRHGDVELHAVLAPGKAEIAADVLAASAEYLARYEPLIGPYPFAEFTVLEAFFSSGFAFPGCTQIAGSQLSEYQQYRRHGYLDHELLHNWWGNGVLVDPDDGNWCEALSSYLGNYYGYVLDGDEEGARRHRRNASNQLSALTPEEDLPLGTFGQEDGVGRGVGYLKGAMVFHMLEQRIGADAFFAGLRRLAAERMGVHADWSDLEAALEATSGEELGWFFDQWIRRGGAPALELVSATRPAGSDELTVTISQGDADFDVAVPLRLFFGERSEDVVVAMSAPEAVFSVPVRGDDLVAVELDPDYDVFRRLRPAETMPTSALTRRASSLLVVEPDGEVDEGYQVVVDAYTHAVLGDEEEPETDHEVVVRTAGALEAGELGSGSVLVLGEAVRHPAIAALLERTRDPVQWIDGGFRVEGESYPDPGHAVFFTVHHPDREDAGITVYAGNSPTALSNARVLGYYPNSLLVFETPPADGPEPTDGMPRARVLRRDDFESHDRIELPPP